MKHINPRRIIVFGMFILLILVVTDAVSLENHSITKTEAENLVYKLEKNVSYLKSAGFTTIRIDDGLDDMRYRLASGDYDYVYATYFDLTSLIEELLYLDMLINKTSILIEEAEKRELDLGDTLLEYNAGVSEFQNNNFEASKTRLENSYNSVVEKLEGKSAGILEQYSLIMEQAANNSIATQSINTTLLSLRRAQKENDFATIFLMANEIDMINASINMLIEIKQEILALQIAGYSTKRMDDIYFELEHLVNSKDYTNLFSRYKETVRLIDTVYKLDQDINDTRIRIQNPELQGIDFSESEYYLNLSVFEFKSENYEQSENYLKQANDIFHETERKHLFASIVSKAKHKLSPLEFLKKNWWKLLIILPILLLSYKITRYYIMLWLLRLRIDKLQKEHKAIIELTKKLQLDYFKHKLVDKSTYTQQYSEFEIRRSNIEEELPYLESELEQESNKLEEIKHSLPFMELFISYVQKKGDKNAAAKKKAN
ncbi:hypothetical protein JW930_07790 [Candidatus Woesearchaeota archaeon]|nr:hypothetical protein [Candidatus Woesearchaeota archaeon]